PPFHLTVIEKSTVLFNGMLVWFVEAVIEISSFIFFSCSPADKFKFINKMRLNADNRNLFISGITIFSLQIRGI
ncbi:MAG: hypothetical protein HWN67_12120, partial [Candidatus Helarchaeota archaeon]|nr:hypothetical protein [Candidatus Helarchaeota archaeon]